MVELSFSLEGGEVVHRRLGIVAEGVTSFREPLDQIGRNFMKVFDLNFSTRGATYGGWAPRARQYPWPLLERTGRMREGFQRKVDRKSLTLDNEAPYFVYHQSSAPRQRLPRRVMMKIRAQDATMIVKEFQFYLIKLLRMRGVR